MVDEPEEAVYLDLDDALENYAAIVHAIHATAAQAADHTQRRCA